MIWICQVCLGVSGGNLQIRFQPLKHLSAPSVTLCLFLNHLQADLLWASGLLLWSTRPSNGQTCRMIPLLMGRKLSAIRSIEHNTNNQLCMWVRKPEKGREDPRMMVVGCWWGREALSASTRNPRWGSHPHNNCICFPLQDVWKVKVNPSFFCPLVCAAEAQPHQHHDLHLSGNAHVVKAQLHAEDERRRKPVRKVRARSLPAEPWPSSLQPLML